MRPFKSYFFTASGFDSLIDEGPVGVVGDIPVPVDAPAPVAELDDDAPVAPGVVVTVVLDDGAGVGAATGAGAGAVTVFSSFLQAVRPTATSAAMSNERVIFYIL